MGFFRNLFGKFWPLFVMGFMLFLFLNFSSSKRHLDAFVNGDSTYTVLPETEKEEVFDSFTYTSDEIALEMEIPSGWERVTKSGYDTFVHAPSASSIQIQILPYSPQINNTDENELNLTYNDMGYKFTGIAQLMPNCYYITYQKYNTAGEIDYIELNMWDREHILKVIVTLNDQNYEKLESTIWNSIYSISWDYEAPIAANCYLHYSIDGDFEFAVPLDWQYDVADGSFYGYDPNDPNCTMTVELIEDSIRSENVSQNDYAKLIGNGLQGFSLEGYSQDEDSIYAEAIFMSGDIQMSLMQYLFMNGKYLYRVTYYSPYDYITDFYPVVYDWIQMTRIFYDAESETENGASDPLDPLQANATLSLEEYENSIIDRATQSAQTSPLNSDSSADEEVSTLADALVSVAGIPYEQAALINQVWENSSCGIPASADAIKESDTTLIVQITNLMGTSYYAFINKASGALQSFHMNSEDGPVLYPEN